MLLDAQSTQNPPLSSVPTPPQKYPRTMMKSEANKRLNHLKAEHLLVRPAFMEFSRFVDPLRGKFDTPPQKRAQLPDYKTLLYAKAKEALDIMASGLSSGMTSQTMPWFKLTVDGQDELSEPSREWLDKVENIMYRIFAKSNLYGCLHNCYQELGTFGTGCFLVTEDLDTVVRGRSFTAGEYYLGQDGKGKINAFAREFWMTAGQMVDEFGYDNCSAAVRQNHDYNQKDVWYKVFHLIEENDNRIDDLDDYKNMPYRSIYWENSDQTDRFLATRGFKIFPVIAPRWSTYTTDQVWGYGPSWYALGDNRQLQKTEKDRLIAQEKSHNPPMLRDSSVDHFANIPGGISAVSGTVPNSGVRPAYQITYDYNGFKLATEDLAERISRAFFTHVFMMISNNDRTNKTATEIAELQQEKIQMLGPILYKLNEELLDPLIDVVFDYALNLNVFPPAPDEIAGAKLKVEYVSILAQSLKEVGVNSLNRVIGFIQGVGTISPDKMMEAAENIDFDAAVRDVADREGIAAKIVVDKAVVQQNREIRQQQMQQQAMVQQGQASADSLAKLGKVQMGDSNAAEKLLKANGAS